MVQFYVFLEVSAGYVVNIAEMEVTGHINCDLLVDTDCTETDGLALIFELFKVDLQVLGGYLICQDLDGQLVDTFEIRLHSQKIFGETNQLVH